MSALLSLPADADDDATLVSTNASEQHHAQASGEQRPHVDVYWSEGEVAVIASCAGCLLDIQTLAYTGSQPQSAKPIDFTGQVDNDAVDSARIAADVAPNLPFALVVALTLVDDAGKAFDELHTFFGRIDEAGEFTTLTWAEFACERGFVHCFHDEEAKIDVIDLGSVESATVDGVEIAAEVQ